MIEMESLSVAEAKNMFNGASTTLPVRFYKGECHHVSLDVRDLVQLSCRRGGNQEVTALSDLRILPRHILAAT